MKKIFIVLIIISLIVGGGIWWYFSNKKDDTNQNSNYQAERSSTNVNYTKDTSNQNQNTNTTKQETKPKTETEIASFSTKIHNKEKARQNNMEITAQTLTNTEVPAGETFSFCNTVGKATTERGYQEADIYVEGEKKKGLGGGNCQVSTTLYNAVVQIPELEVVERHQHSGYVPYIQKGKDAAVAYGSNDFKFKNNTGNAIKIVMEKTVDNITARIIKIS